MAARRSLKTEEMLGLLAATLVVLLLLPTRRLAAPTIFAIVLTVSITTLGVAAALIAHRSRPLDVVAGFVVVVAGTALSLPTAVFVVATPVVSVEGMAAIALTTLVEAFPVAVRVVLQWGLPAALLFPLGLAETERARVAVVLTLLVALVGTVVLVPTPTVGTFASTVIRFVAAAALGGPLFVAARSFPQQFDLSLVGVQ